MPTEQQLIAACLLENRVAQRQLYDRYKRAMYTLAYRITGSFEEADDVLQDGFLEVFRHLGQFRSESTLGAWIRKIIVRKAILHRKRMVLEFLPVEEAEQSIDWGNEAIDLAHLEEAILSLPEGYRTVFVLIEVEGFAHHEVSAMLGISEGTSKSQLFHAKKRLKRILTIP